MLGRSVLGIAGLALVVVAILVQLSIIAPGATVCIGPFCNQEFVSLDASFNADTNPNNNSVIFTDTTGTTGLTGTYIAGISWGDGGSVGKQSIGYSTTHIYPKPGTYSITESVFGVGPLGDIYFSNTTQSVAVPLTGPSYHPQPPLVLFFNVTSYGLTVNATDTSQINGAVIGNSWSWGDGSKATNGATGASSHGTVTHTYAKPGIYTIIHQVYVFGAGASNVSGAGGSRNVTVNSVGNGSGGQTPPVSQSNTSTGPNPWALVIGLVGVAFIAAAVLSGVLLIGFELMIILVALALTVFALAGGVL